MRGGCGVPGCGGQHHARGYCHSHYERLRNRGTLELAGEPSLSEAWKAYLRAFDALLRHREAHVIPTRLMARLRAARGPLALQDTYQGQPVRLIPRELLWNCEDYRGMR